ncbi:MAG: hypothetical protein EOP22_14225 [Hyphomicrobiales bacterium]|nr:MAG: hypothetical protein EOP22_14225 [Hyphomicrobiales bacterium]
MKVSRSPFPHLPALTLALLVSVASAGMAAAQNVSNEAWLGQVGGLNVLDITQEGRGNSAGADNVWLLLGQQGVSNSLVLDQFGYDNKLGTLFGDQPRYARGVWQRGDLNVMSIVQRNTELGGTNVLGSVQQWSAFNQGVNSDAFNSLTVIQTSLDDPTGIGGHYIGRIVQVNNRQGDAAHNAVTITQQGGGEGLGNVLANLRQVGSGNSFTSLQTGSANRVGEIPPAGELPIGGILQRGAENVASLEQRGTSNLVEYIQQYGELNSAQLTFSGSRNVLSQLLQNNESWIVGAIGNRTVVTITGDDNGGEGGWVGELIAFPSLATPGIAQAVLAQLGDDNDISLAILSGMESKYGVTQVGDGNDVHISISGLAGADAFRNETAVFQKGNVNYVSHTVTGDDNAGAVRMEGEGNRLVLVQRESFNVARVTITGDMNNAPSAPLFGVAAELVASLAEETLFPGRIVQIGLGGEPDDANSAELDVLGSGNAFTAYQNGLGNHLLGSIAGDGNALAVLQTGNRNTTLSRQAGSANSAAIQQF